MAENTVALNFEGVTIAAIDARGMRWMTQTDLAKALYGIKGGDTSDTPLSAAERAVKRIFAKNKDEFTETETDFLLMETSRGLQQVRIYSSRGCSLMTILAKTERAKAFRVWVLDVLEERGTLTRDTPSAEKETAGLTDTAKLAKVRECRLTYGHRSAQRLWVELGLETVPEMFAPPRQPDLWAATIEGLAQ